MVVSSSASRRAAFESLLRARMLRTLIRVRARGVFVVATLAAAFAFADPLPARIALFVVGIGTVGSLTVFELTRLEQEATPRRVALNVWITLAGQTLIVLGTGGIAGPLVPAMVLFAIVSAIFVSPNISLPGVVLMLVPAIWVYAYVQATGAIPGIVPGPMQGLFAAAGSPGNGAWIAAALYTLMLVGGTALGRFLRTTVDELIEQQVEDRERALEMHAEQNRTLSALSAEIAHELKNPLASVKGLAALVQKDVSGATAERLTVLRREVDRMQAVLDEFLAYSRPLVPLDPENVDVTALVREIVELHEGMAEERGVRLEVVGEPAGHRCDPRKLRSVLINLVQNAIEASPRGELVRVEIVRTDDGGLRACVLDRGLGIDPAIAGRLFTVGATTKEKGNGLGLAVARGLARQHGGELVLEKRQGGGAAAIVTLPAEPTMQGAAA